MLNVCSTPGCETRIVSPATTCGNCRVGRPLSKSERKTPAPVGERPARFVTLPLSPAGRRAAEEVGA